MGNKKVESMTKEDIRVLTRENTIQEMESKYSKNELIMMYKTVYETYPRSGQKKVDLIQSIQTHFSSLNRLRAFNVI